MGLTKTSYTIENAEYDDSSASSNFCRYNLDGSVFTRYYGGSGESTYFIHNTGYGTTYQVGTVRFRLQTDSAGVGTLKATLPYVEADGSFQYCLTTSRTMPDSGWKTVFSGTNHSNYTFTVSNAKMLPNTVYYLWMTGVVASDSNCFLTAPVTFTPSGTYGEPGSITANNANFGSAVSMSYASSTTGGTYTVTVAVPITGGSTRTTTLQTQSSTSSRTWTPALATYGPLITDTKSVTATITVKTYFGGTLSGTKTKNIKLTFASADAAPVLDNAFSIAPYNTGSVSGLTGYIAGYSKIRATYTSGNVTLKYGASVSKWTVKFGSASAVDVAAGTVTKDSAVQAASTSYKDISVVCTLTDSRGYTASETYTARLIPYAAPTLTAKVWRTDQDGNEQDDGTYFKVDFTAKVSALATNSSNVSGTHQNSVAVSMKFKPASGSTWTTQTGLANSGSTSYSGNTMSFTRSGYLKNGFLDIVYNVQIILTDKLGNTATITVTIQSAAWALNIRGGGSGAAIGKSAEADDQMQIPEAWDYYTGTYPVVETKTQSLTDTQKANARSNIGIAVPIDYYNMAANSSVTLTFTGNGCVLFAMRSTRTRQIAVFDYWSTADNCKIVNPDSTDYMTYTKSSNSTTLTITRAAGGYAAALIAIGGTFST